MLLNLASYSKNFLSLLHNFLIILFTQLFFFCNQDYVVLLNTHIDPMNKTENPEVNAHKYALLILDRGAKAVE